jgi:hypothetical protein
MYRPLVPCDRCARHVRSEEVRCHFCGQPVSDAMRAIKVVPLPAGQLSRAGTLAFVAAMTLAGCKEDSSPGIAKDSPKTKTKTSASASTKEPDTGLVDDPGAIVTAYGTPPMPMPSPSPSVKPKPKSP